MLWIPIDFFQYHLKDNLLTKRKKVFSYFVSNYLKSKPGEQPYYDRRIPWCVLNDFPPGFDSLPVVRISLLKKLFTGTPSIIRENE